MTVAFPILEVASWAVLVQSVRRTIILVLSGLAYICSLLDYMGYSHGSDEDWARYADLSGDAGWKWDNMEKYARRV